MLHYINAGAKGDLSMVLDQVLIDLSKRLKYQKVSRLQDFWLTRLKISDV